MSDDTSTPMSPEAKVKAAVRDAKQRLIQMGMNPDAAAAEVERVRDRIYAGGKGPIRVLRPLSQGEFYPGNFEDPLGDLVSEIFLGAPDDQKLVAVTRHEEAVQEIMAQKARTNSYLL
jgi:hypothetical protein